MKRLEKQQLVQLKLEDEYKRSLNHDVLITTVDQKCCNRGIFSLPGNDIRGSNGWKTEAKKLVPQISHI